MWRYKSSDYNNVSLHDNSFEEINFSGSDVILVFNEGFDILSSHPLNDTGKSKHTTKSQIILSNSAFLNGVVHLSKLQSSHALKFDEIMSLFSTSFKFNVLAFSFVADSDDTTLVLDGCLSCSAMNYNSEFSEISFSCKNYSFCWNEFCEDAWFENWPG